MALNTGRTGGNKGLISSFAPGGEPHVTPAGRVIEGEFERKDP